MAKTLKFSMIHFYEFMPRKCPEYANIYIKYFFSAIFVIVINYKHIHA